MTGPTHGSLPSSSTETEPVPQTIIRKSSRHHRAPGYLEYYTCSALYLTNVSAACFLVQLHQSPYLLVVCLLAIKSCSTLFLIYKNILAIFRQHITLDGRRQWINNWRL